LLLAQTFKCEIGGGPHQLFNRPDRHKPDRAADPKERDLLARFQPQGLADLRWQNNLIFRRNARFSHTILRSMGRSLYILPINQRIGQRYVDLADYGRFGVCQVLVLAASYMASMTATR